MKQKIVMIGAGNVATHLCIALRNAGYIIPQVFSRTISNAECLAPLVDAEAIDSLSEIDTQADLYIISVSDSAIQEVAREMPDVSGVVVHTAGSIEMNALDRFPLHGIMYPFQTFTREKELEFSQVPVLVEGNASLSKKMVWDVANAISDKVQKANGSKRKTLHISAVFACNFVNHLYALADDLLEKEGLNFSMLEPLIKETTQKALSMKPVHAQTGPATRGDREVMNNHMEALNSGTFHHDIYALLSESIYKFAKNEY
jgi:predicted short-subunit dehydrogenase-like oxidoreductase (DUF2520 family)